MRQIQINSKQRLSTYTKHVMKANGGVGAWLRLFLPSALDGGEWSASCSGRYVTEKRAPLPTE